MEAWFAALERQLKFYAAPLREGGYFLETIFWGGGTPSLVPNDLLLRVGELLRANFRLDALQEFTIEANPETLDTEKLQALRDAGATRISIGIQSFQDRFLDRLERRARRDDNLRALELVATHWGSRWSLDLMFGLPEQTMSEWDSDLRQALAFSPDHLSLYQLTLTTARSRSWKQPLEPMLADMDELAETLCAEKGLKRYEISNFSKPGQESKHNLKYWRLEPFLGVGPGASGLLNGALARQVFGEDFSRFGVHQKVPDHFDTWAQWAGNPAFERKGLSVRAAMEHLEELLMMGLRLEEGLSSARIPDGLRELANSGQSLEVIDSDGSFKMSSRGRKILDALLPKIFKFAEDRGLDSAEIDPRF